MDYVQQFKNAKVLVCDDDPTHNILMQEVLEAEGFKVIIAVDGLQAIDQYYSHSPDIVLLDVAMPNKNGFQVCEEIRKTPYGKEVPILMITSAGDVDSISAAFKAGATDFLSKPIKWQLIAHRVAYMLHSSYAVEELKNSQSKLTYLAYFDALTGLPNKHNLQEFVHNNFFKSTANNKAIALIHIRLGFLNSPYSSLGHKIADQFIQLITERLDMILREHGHVDEYENSIRLARTSDDEFSLCWLDFDEVTLLEALINKLLLTLKGSVIINDYQLEITPKIGVACFPETAKSVEQLITNSTIASYNADANGFCYYDLGDNQLTKDNLNLEQQLRLSLSEGKLDISFQPILDISNSQVVAKQASLLWKNPHQGKVSIEQFKRTLNNKALLIELEMKGLELVFSALTGQANQMSINFPLSIESCLSSNFTACLSEFIKRQPTLVKLLSLEVDNQLLEKLQGQELTIFKKFRRNGGQIVVTNLSMASDICRWVELSLTDQFKLTPSMLLTPIDRSVTQVILSMAKSLNYKVIVDGEIEYLPIEQFKRLGCDYVYSRVSQSSKSDMMAY